MNQTSSEMGADAGRSAGGAPLNLSGQTLHGLFWLFSGTGIQALLRMAVLMVLARLIAPSAFGLIAAAQVVISFAEIFSKSGIGPVLVQRERLEERHIRTAFWCSILVGALLGVVVWLLVPFIAGLFRMPSLEPVLRAMVVLFPLNSVAVVGEAILQRNLRFKVVAGVDVASYILGYGAVGIPLAIAGAGVWSLVIAALVQSAATCVLVLALQPHPKAVLLDVDALRDLIYFGGGFTTVRLFNHFALQSDNIIVGRWLGSQALGLYGRAYNLMTAQAMLFGSVLDRVLFPAFAKLQSERHRVEDVYRKGRVIVAAVTIPVSLVAVVLAPEFIAVFLGPGWEAATLPFQILVVGTLFRTSYKVSAAVARAMGAVYGLAWRQLVYAAFVVVGAGIGQEWGIAGVAAGVLIALVVNDLLLGALAMKLSRCRWWTIAIAQLPGMTLGLLALVASLVAATGLRSIGSPPLLVLIGAAAFTALAAILGLVLVPRILIGTEVVWFVDRFLGVVPGKARQRLLLHWGSVRQRVAG